MSKIAKALQKAGEERGTTVPQPARNTSSAGMQPVTAASPDPLLSPVYSQTAVCTNLAPGLLDEGRLVGGSLRADLCDAINVLRTQVLHRTRRKGWNTILVTSPNPGAGKTTVAINLALSLAREMNQTAMLVDLNMRAPTIADRLGLGKREGLTDYLSDNVPLERLLVNPGIPKLVVLPSGTKTTDAADLVGSPQMKRLIDELKNRYPERYVILDAPHVVGLPDTLVCAEYVDAILLVAGDSETKQQELRQTQELLEGRNVIGVVLNKAR